MVKGLRRRLLGGVRTCRFDVMTNGVKLAGHGHLRRDNRSQNQLNREQIGGCNTDYPFQQ